MAEANVDGSACFGQVRKYREAALGPTLWEEDRYDTRVPEPIEDEAFCNGEVAKISPNSALLLLNPVVPTFAILFDVADISAEAPFSPVRAV